MARTLDGLKQLLGTNGDTIGDLFENASNVINFTNGDTPTADKTYAQALALHNAGRPLVARVKVSDTVSATSCSYALVNGNLIFGLSILGMVSGTVVWDAESITITIEE